MNLIVLILSTLLCWLLSESNSVHSANDKRVRKPSYRLPNDVVPIKYDLQVNTSLNEHDFSFVGKVWIKIRCVRSTNKIILHSKDLNINQSSTELSILNRTDCNDSHISIIKQQLVVQRDFYEIILGRNLNVSQDYLCYIKFSGKLVENLCGYYRTRYYDQESTTAKWLAVTQFEPTDARKAFPCFDEPTMKAVFSITLGHSNKYKAISNMPLKTSNTETDGWVMDTFEDTLPTSTYLTAYMIFDFDYRESNYREIAPRIQFRVWARKDAFNQTEFAADIGPKFLAFFERYFNINYPLPKQDMVAVPDFGAGAMENWGLVTYRETALLCDPVESSLHDKHTIAVTVSHELSHQWFGNLVTMDWWTDLWLNEGFATYVGALGVKHVIPQWNSFESDTLVALITVLQLDALKSSHPVSVSIGHPSEIDQIFDIISYQKGFYLLHMINQFLGESVFRKGVTKYLLRHRYKNAVQDDLWISLTEAAEEMGSLNESGISVKRIMDSWTVQTGYPVITVERHYENGTAVISQERYLSSKTHNVKSKIPCWWIPISYTTSEEKIFNVTTPRLWLTDNEPKTVNSLPSSAEWVIFNVKYSGLYRVNYDQKNWELLNATLRDKKRFTDIDKMNRIQIILDSTSLAWIGKQDYRFVFEMLKFLQHEKEYLVWKAALTDLHQLNSVLAHSGANSYFKKYVRNLIEPSYKRLGKNITKLPSSFERIKHHCMILHAACYYDLPECIQDTKNLFQKWYRSSEKKNSIPTSLRRTVYCSALKKCPESHWTFLWNRYLISNAASEKSVILATLSCSEDLQILERYLQWSLDVEKIRRQDSLLIFNSIAYNNVGFIIAKEFLVKNFSEIYAYHVQRPSVVGQYIQTVMSQITLKKDLSELHTFIKVMSFKLKEADIAIRQGVETAKSNIAWHADNFKTVFYYLMDAKF